MADFELTMTNVLHNFSGSDITSVAPFTADQQQHDEIENIEATVSVIVPILFILIVIIGSFGNAAVLMVIKSYNNSQPTNVLIANLAAADLLFIITCVPATAWDYAVHHWIFGQFWCKAVQALIEVFAYVSIYTLVLMSIDRYLAIVRPLTALRWRTPKQIIRAIVFLWIVFGALAILPYRNHGLIYGYDNDGTTEIALCTFMRHHYNERLYRVPFFVFAYLVPIAIISILYVLIVKQIWYNTHHPHYNVNHEIIRQRRQHITRMVIIVVVVFAVCWAPIQIVLLLKSFDLYDMTIPGIIIQITANTLAYANSCLNPFLYAFLAENFRVRFWKIVTRCGKRSRDEPIPNETHCEMSTVVSHAEMQQNGAVNNA